MATSIPLTMERGQAEGARKHTVPQFVKIGPVSLRILTIASLASLLLFYLAQTTQSATTSIDVQSLTQKQDELTQDVERMQLEAQRLQTLGAIQQGLGTSLATDFEAVKDVKAVE
jgi:outer membrane murein-binding lipoprotein Lpp